MPRIRTIKPEFFTHPEVIACSIPARLLLVSLLTQADDEGRLYDQPRKILSNAFGENDRVKVALLDELADRGRVCRYAVDERACLHVLHFTRHQTISHPRPSSIPPCRFHADSGNVPGILPEASSQEGNGMEGNGFPRRGRRSPRPPDEAWNAMVKATGLNVGSLSKADRERVNGQLLDLRKRGGTPEEITRRAGNSPLQPPTLDYLVRNWAALDAERRLVGAPRGAAEPPARYFEDEQ